MVRSSLFVQRLEKLQDELASFYQQEIASSEPNVQHLLAQAYKELGHASEELKLASEEITVQAENLRAQQRELDRERHRYFNGWFGALLITNERGIIIRGNREAGLLLNIEPRFLADKPIETFLTPSERRLFPTKIKQLVTCKRLQQWQVAIQPRDSQSASALLRAVPVQEQNYQTIQWNLHLAPPYLQPVSTTYNSNVQHYEQGDNIPLEPDVIWLVCQGIVKLSTTGAGGEEILCGLVGPTMPFGACLTSLSIYQATAAMPVKLVATTFAEINETPHLQDFTIQLIQRLKQTETLLNIFGQRHVQERLNYLLNWLKENFGQACPQGTQLTVRLTHQDLANTCCTTRVTISRLISKLKQKQKLTYNSDYYLIFLDEGEAPPAQG